MFDEGHSLPGATDLIQTIESSIAPSDPGRRSAGQHMTPDWAAEAIVAHYFADLTLWTTGLSRAAARVRFFSVPCPTPCQAAASSSIRFWRPELTP